MSKQITHLLGRKLLRLPGYDYATGAFFITSCVGNRQPVFGEIVDGTMHLNHYGQAVIDAWKAASRITLGVYLDEFVVMPNHFHGIVVMMQLGGHDSKVLGDVMRQFKSQATKQIRALGLSNFSWQRNYYEHVIRGEKDLAKIREYIVNNPAKWAEDEENPGRSQD